MGERREGRTGRGELDEYFDRSVGVCLELTEGRCSCMGELPEADGSWRRTAVGVLRLLDAEGGWWGVKSKGRERSWRDMAVGRKGGRSS